MIHNMIYYDLLHYSFFRDVLGCSVVFLDVFLFIYVFFGNPGTNLVITVMFTSSFYPMRAQCFVTAQEITPSKM